MKFTTPVPFDPDRSVTLAICVWKLPFALPEKLSTTRYVLLPVDEIRFVKLNTAVPLFAE